MTIKVFEAFAGIGTQRMALRNLGINHEVVAIAEIDKYAIKSYEAIHGKVNNLGDISKIEATDIPNHDLFTYSFPCQDISLAGKQKGLSEDSGTRSSLLWECRRVIESKKPKYLLMENVKNLVGKKFKADFDKWLEYLESLGYTNYYQVLNAKDYGVPQNRERVFAVSILGEHEPYEFPKPIPLELRLKDVLESVVDEKYYLDDEQTKRLTGNSFHQANVRLQEKEYADTLLARDYKDHKCVRVGGIFDKDDKKHQAGAIWDKEQLSPTLDTMQGGWRQPSIIIDDTQGFEEDARVYEDYSPSLRASRSGLKTIELEDIKIAASRGRNPENPSDRTIGVPTEQRLEINKQGTSNTITTVQKDNYVVEPTYRIRKLTPKECWRLMGCSDEDFHKAEQVNSNTQLYKQAGNAIVVDVLERIFEKLFGGGVDGVHDNKDIRLDGQ